MIYKFPTKNTKKLQVFFRGKGVPDCAFHFRKFNIERVCAPLTWEQPKSKKIRHLSIKKQLSYFKEIKKNPQTPRFILIGTGFEGQGYTETSKLLFILMYEAYNRLKLSGKEPLWYKVYDNQDKRLIRYYKDSIEQASISPSNISFLVLDNLYENSTNNHYNKARDIINFYKENIPVIVIIQGMNCFEFSQKILYMDADMHFNIKKPDIVL